MGFGLGILDTSRLVCAKMIAKRVWLALPLLLGTARAAPGSCPEDMASVDGRYCVDRYEASLIVVDTGKLHSPFELLKEGQRVRAVSRSGVHPQAHISQEQAASACEEAGKRLCTRDEWVTACKGRVPTLYPYGQRHRPGYCNDAGVSPLGILSGKHKTYDDRTMNDRRLNQVPGTLARTGTYHRCQNEYGIFDMSGNLHEWTAETKGEFHGGYYLDTTMLGEGCEYVTDGHDKNYRDYSVGFRCCSDASDGG